MGSFWADPYTFVVVWLMGVLRGWGLPDDAAQLILFILGAASNVIIIQNAEKSGETITFLEFAKVGVPLTALNILVYWIFL